MPSVRQGVGRTRTATMPWKQIALTLMAKVPGKSHYFWLGFYFYVTELLTSFDPPTVGSRVLITTGAGYTDLVPMKFHLISRDRYIIRQVRR